MNRIPFILPSMNRRNFLKAASATLAAVHAHAALGAHPWLRAFAVHARQASGDADAQRLLFGVDYYPDQTAESLWVEDAAKMKEFGVTNVRIAEFAWGLMEPSEGRFDFAWLHRSVEILNKHDIAVILGTPSAAPPPWLSEKYPEILEVNEQGVTLNPSGRRFTCPTNKQYRRLALAIATEMAHSFADTPGVIGWQIDNEFTLGSSGRCYCHACRAGFQDWLRGKYKSLDELNRVWGTAFWSQTYTDFAQIPVPLPSGAPPNPTQALDYDRYQSYANASFLGEQLAMLRTACPRHFVTTNNVGLADTIDLRELYAGLDFASGDNYPAFFSVMFGEPGTSVPAQALAPMISLSLDFMRGVKGGKPFLIMEEQSGKSGQPTFSAQPDPGQLRLWSYQVVAHGAMGINYFRWDTATFGAEEYWHGLLNHDRSPSPGYEEMRQTVRELKSLGHELLYASCVAQAALVFDSNSDWALAIQPGQPKLKYMSESASWYGGIAAAHPGIDIVDATGDLSQYKIVFAPVMYIVSARQAERIRAFVEGGGTFVAGFRLSAKDSDSHIVSTPLPGLLRDVMGVTVEDYVPIYSDKQGVKFNADLGVPDSVCELWADILKPDTTASTLATYTTGTHAGKPAVTSNKFGKGRAFYVGAHLDNASLARVLSTLTAAVVPPLFEAPAGVEIAVRQSGGKRWLFLLNHTREEQAISLPGAYKDALTKQAVSGSVRLGGYGAQVLEMS